MKARQALAALTPDPQHPQSKITEKRQAPSNAAANHQSSSAMAVVHQQEPQSTIRQPEEDDPHRRRGSRMMMSTHRPPPPPMTQAQRAVRARRHRDSIAVTKLHQGLHQHLLQIHETSLQQQKQVERSART